MMAFRGGHHDKMTKRMAGCGSKSAQRRARKKACNKGTKVPYARRRAEGGAR